MFLLLEPGVGRGTERLAGRRPRLEVPMGWSQYLGVVWLSQQVGAPVDTPGSVQPATAVPSGSPTTPIEALPALLCNLAQLYSPRKPLVTSLPQ